MLAIGARSRPRANRRSGIAKDAAYRALRPEVALVFSNSVIVVSNGGLDPVNRGLCFLSADKPGNPAPSCLASQ